MALSCLTWILHIYNKKTGDRDDDDGATGVEDLSTTFLEQGNRIIKKWPMLTKLSHYIEHWRRDRQLILSYHGCGFLQGSRLSIINGKSEKVCKARELKALSSACIVNCHNGLVLLTSSYPVHHHVVVNPLSNKTVTRISPLFWGGYPCAIFFHPLAKEFRVLNVQRLGFNFEYHLYLFGSKTWRKTNTPYFNCGPPDCEDSKQSRNCNPAIANGALHWNVGENKIMVFDTISEEFCVKQYPLIRCDPKGASWLRDLLVNEDRLCLFMLRCLEPALDVWILEDYAKWSWTRKYIVNLDWDTIEYPLDKGYTVGPYIVTYVRAIGIHKDELVLYWGKRGLFSYDLRFKTIQKVSFRKTKEMDSDLSMRYGSTCRFMYYSATNHN